ncbi:MAG: family 10 glycosylhydrolase [Candidatus Sumerlaeia bacterium]|nr:family 10 glycosylhydrolase [Candidatus Sumerlaeia bacterium]
METRGVWITNVDSSVMNSRESIAEAMDFLALSGFNIVYPVVWNQGYTLYPSALMEEHFGVSIHPRFEGRDPLAEMIVEAHRVGLEIVPWFEYGFATSHQADGGHIIERYPHWASLDKDGNLTTKNGFEWMNALDAEVQEFVTSLVLEVAEKYDVDGIQGDDRMPAMPTEGGYNPEVTARYLAETGREAPDNHKELHWVQWRADILTDWLEDLRDRVKAVDPNLAVSMSPSYWPWARDEYLQDSKTWTERGLVDSLHPQAYRYNVEAYKEVIDNIVDNQLTDADMDYFAPGLLTNLGTYLIDRDYFITAMDYHRERGVKGEVYFFYESLRRNDNWLGHLVRNRYYQEPSRLPYREDRTWRPGGIQINFDQDLQNAPSRATKVAGSWGRTPMSLHFRQLAAGEAGFLSYELTAPATGIYDVYTLQPAPDAGNWGSVHYSVVDENPSPQDFSTPRNALVIDQNSGAGGWTKVATVSLSEGESRWLGAFAEADREFPVIGGPVMLLLNRRLSPDTQWPASQWP